MVFEPVDGNADVWKPTSSGESIEGVYAHCEPGSDKLSSRYYLRVGKEMRMVWGTAIIDSRMPFVKIGETVRIVFRGVGKTKEGRPLKEFDVLVDRPRAEQGGVVAAEEEVVVR